MVRRPTIPRARPRERLAGPLRRDHEEALARLAAAVRELRHARGLTQEALAERADLSTAIVAVVEGRRSNVTLGTMVALAQGLDVDIERLLRRPSPRRKKRARETSTPS